MTPINLRRLEFELRRIRRIPLPTLAGKVATKFLGLGLGLALLPVTALLHLAGYRHVTIFTDRIGHLALEPDCLLKEQALGNIPHRKWIMLAPPGRVANEHLLTYWQPHFWIVRSRFACFLIASMSRWGLMRYDVSRYVRAIGKAQAAYRVYTEWCDRLPLLRLTEQDEAWGRQKLQGLGLPEGAWFVCVHAREGGFSPIDEELHSHRNNNIENTISAVQEVTKRGGWVIRIGDPSMRHLPQIPQVIDYAHHHMKSARLDIVLCAKARFFLGNTSGIALVSSAFGVPCALTNMIPAASLWFGKRDISIPKLIWSQHLGRNLRLDELLNSAVATYQYAVLYEADGLQATENNSDDIHNLACEMLDRLDSCFVMNEADETRWMKVEVLLNHKHYSYRSAARFGVSFLRNHPELLPHA
jgi:putative glycosyltransferase (TIGR04372 family)